MGDQTEHVLRQELRTLQIMNDSKSREIATQSDYVKRLQKRNKLLEDVVAATRVFLGIPHDDWRDQDKAYDTLIEQIEKLDKEDPQ